MKALPFRPLCECYSRQFGYLIKVGVNAGSDLNYCLLASLLPDYFLVFIVKEKIIIGRLERVEFPDLHLSNIDAKIDTGAYSSSLHCHHIEKIEHKGKASVRFNLLDPEHPAYNEMEFILPIHDERRVRSSNGIIQDRIFISTSMVLSNKTFRIELSLSDRSEMKYPVLLGRKFLRHRFIVDVSKKHIHEIIKHTDS